MSLSPCERVENALRGEKVDTVPFTVYDNLLPRCEVERILRNRGLCCVIRLPGFKTVRPDVKVKQEIIFEGKRKLIRTYYETPRGNLSRLEESTIHTTWILEHLFKSPDDYRALRFFLSNERYEPDYETFSIAEKRFGRDGIFRAGFGLEPLQSLISGEYFSTEKFCTEWMDNRDEVFSLYEIIVENRRKIYPLVAKSPALHANYGGNVVPEIVGPENFEKYYLPHYNEASEVMHKHGKFIGSHFDANCEKFAGLIAESGLDYIEAFTPYPDTDMTLGEARKIWKNKAIWLNFPSSVHLAPEEKIEGTVIKLLDEAGTPERLLMGITENVPEERWQKNYMSIMRGIEKHAGMNDGFYIR